ncbi:MAG: 1,4-dihydroxy-2-naphthoate octaprenyltransferase [Paraprevotella sp.]|nr:1,4-dihydroxy-2-naphthoate octaprenyltransferase [Paraprevotella sp.]
MSAPSTNSLKAWLLAARPQTLTGAAVPVMLGISSGCSDGRFRIIPAVLCFLFAFLMQIDANFINDYYDFKKGLDDEKRLGPKRACAEGWITLPAMRRGIAVATILSGLFGLPLIAYGGWSMIAIGVCCVVFCFLYTTYMARKGMGDLLVLVFFGIVPVCTTYYLQTQTVTWAVAVLSVACGAVTDGLLVVNNYRDRDNDKSGGKITLVVKIGEKAAEKLYLWLGIAAVLLCQLLWWIHEPIAAALSVIYLVPHCMTWRRMKAIYSGKALNGILGETARNILIFGLLVSIGLIF